MSRGTHHAAIDAANAFLFGDKLAQSETYRSLRDASPALVYVANGGLSAEGERTRVMYSHEAVAYYYNEFMEHTDSARYPRFLPVLVMGRHLEHGDLLEPGFLLKVVSKIGSTKPFEQKVKNTIQTLYMNGRATMLETAVASMIVTH